MEGVRELKCPYVLIGQAWSVVEEPAPEVEGVEEHEGRVHEDQTGLVIPELHYGDDERQDHE